MEFLSLDRVQVNPWVADVVPRETSPATRSEGKRLFSQATNNFIYIQLEITGHYEAKRNKTPQNYYNLFPQRPKLQSIVVAQSWIHFHLIKPDQLPRVQSTNNYFKARGFWIPGKQDGQGIVGRADKSLLTGEFVWLDFKTCLVTAQK